MEIIQLYNASPARRQAGNHNIGLPMTWPNVFNGMMALKPSCKPNSQKWHVTAKHFSQRANKYNYITRPFYDEISKYSQSILANISSTKQ
jgi:hypothetical protein